MREKTMTAALQPVEPAKTPAGYFGGKSAQAKRLAAMIAAIPHRVYAEPFVGMGGVFLRRTRRPQVEVMNDLNQDIATLFRVIQRHPGALDDVLRWQVASRAEWRRLRKVPAETLTDVERAARFIYLQRVAYSGKLRAPSFATGVRARVDVTRLAPRLARLHARLAGVVIECLDWREFVRVWDRPDVLFYLDPPYWGREREYGAPFPRADFAALAGVLGRLQGRFIMSLNDVPEVRDLFGRFRIEEVEPVYNLRASRTRGAKVTGQELIIQGR